MRLANTIASGGCKDWHGAAARVGASFVAADCGTLHAVALTMPTPDDACCGQLREFVEAACGCDADVARLAALGGFGADTPRGGARLATVTRCADPAAGGRQMANKCGGNCVPVLAGQQAGGGVGAAVAPTTPPMLLGGLPTAALPANAAIAPTNQPAAATTSGTASAPAPPGAKPAPSVNVPRARSPSSAPPRGGSGGGGDAMVLTGATGAVPAGGGGAAPGGGGATPAGGAASSTAPAGGAASSTAPAGGAASSTAPGSLPNVNAIMGVVGPGMLNLPVTPGR